MTQSLQHRCALKQASSVQQDAAAKGFDWDHPLDALVKVREETNEVVRLLGAADLARARLREELGDLLFAAVNVARLAKIDPAAALDQATRKFERRFEKVERIARRRGLPMPGTPLEPLDRIWDEVKETEPGG